MKSNILSYALSLAAIVISLIALNKEPAPAQQRMAMHGPERVSRFQWESLGDRTIALGTALEKVGPGKATIFCAAASCHDLELDFDDAFALAKWTDTVEDRPVDSEEEDGISVGPPGPDAEAFAAVLKANTGLDAKIVPIDGIQGIGIIIGKTRYP